MFLRFSMLAFLGLCPTTTSSAGILLVESGQSIQAAIDSAADQDEIVVQSGLYNELIDLQGKKITLRSANGPSRTIIDGSGLDGSVVRCDSGEASDTLLEGFTISGGSGSDSPPLRSIHDLSPVGGGMVIIQSSPTIRNCILTDNSIGFGGGGAMFIRDASPAIIDCDFIENEAQGFGGAAICSLDGGETTIIRCTFIDNNAPAQGGAITNIESAAIAAYNCTFTGNNASFGGCLNQFLGGHASFVNCVFSNNTSSHGSVAYGTIGTTAAYVNCSISGNTAIDNGDVIDNGGEIAFTNCIIWDNGTDPFSGPVLPTISYSDVDGGFDGEGNINLDPHFVNPANDNLQIQGESPCIDAGNSQAYAGPLVDRAGNQRGYDEPSIPDTGIALVGPVIDMGAYEFQAVSACPTDLTGDGIVGPQDLAHILGTWGACP